MIIGLTGSSGYVGTRVAAWLRGNGHQVVGFQRETAPAAGLDRVVPFELAGPADPSVLQGLDLLVHAAYDYRPTSLPASLAVNAEGTAGWLDAAGEAGVPRQLVVSSMSAFAGCRSRYGRTKLEVEKEAARRGLPVVRPGLVWGGGGGLAQALAKLVRRLPLIPVFGGGRQVLYLEHVDDLAALVAGIASDEVNPGPAPFVFAAEEPWPMRRILAALAAAQGRPARFVSLPWRPLYALMAMAEGCGATLPFRSDSLLSLMHQDPAPSFATLRAMGLTPRPFAAETVSDTVSG